MKFLKYIFVFFLLLLLSNTTVLSQTKLILDSSNYPIIKIYKKNITNDIIIKNINDTIPYNLFYCEDSGLVSISIDNSGSMFFNNFIDPLPEDLAKYAGKEIINSFHIPPNAFTLQYCDEKTVEIIDQSKIKNVSLIDKIPAGYGNNFENQLYDGNYGLLILANKGMYTKRFAIIVTDGIWDPFDNILLNNMLSYCLINNIKFFSIFIGGYEDTSNMKESLKYLSKNSFGKYYDNVFAYAQIDLIVKDILKNYYGNNNIQDTFPCGLSFAIKDTCKDNTYYISDSGNIDTIFIKGKISNPYNVKIDNNSKKNYTFNSCQDTIISFDIFYNDICIDSIKVDSIKTTLSWISNKSITLFSNIKTEISLLYSPKFNNNIFDTILIYHNFKTDTVLYYIKVLPLTKNSFTLNNKSIDSNYYFIDSSLLVNPIIICKNDSVAIIYKNISCISQQFFFTKKDSNVYCPINNFSVNPGESYSLIFYLNNLKIGNYNAIFSYVIFGDTAITNGIISIIYKIVNPVITLQLPDTLFHYGNSCINGIDSFIINNNYCVPISINYDNNHSIINPIDSGEVYSVYYGKNRIDSIDVSYNITNDSTIYHKLVYIKEVIKNINDFTVIFDSLQSNLSLCDTIYSKITIINNSCNDLFLDSLISINSNYQYYSINDIILPSDSLIVNVIYVPDFGKEKDSIVLFLNDTSVSHYYSTSIDTIKILKLNYFYNLNKDSNTWKGILYFENNTGIINNLYLHISLHNSTFNFNKLDTIKDTLITNIKDTIIILKGNYYLTTDSTSILSIDSVYYNNRRKCDPIIEVNYFIMIRPNDCGDNILRNYLKNNSIENITIIPNPSQNNFIIISKTNMDATIYNINGKCILQTKTNTLISTNNFISGMYFARINNNIINFVVQK